MTEKEKAKELVDIIYTELRFETNEGADVCLFTAKKLAANVAVEILKEYECIHPERPVRMRFWNNVRRLIPHIA